MFLLFIFYNLIGSSVATDGTLTEPFFLIPVGWLLLALSFVSIICASVFYKYKKPESKPEN
jgi:hypothetical protein